MLRYSIFALFTIWCVEAAYANELVSKSRSPTGSAWVQEHGVSRFVPCYRTVRRIHGQLYVRERECPYPAKHLSDIATPLKQSGPRDARQFKILANGTIQLY